MLLLGASTGIGAGAFTVSAFLLLFLGNELDTRYSSSPPLRL